MSLGFALLLLGKNLYIFSLPLLEDGDFAANSILIEEAKRLHLLVGNYSRIGFNHPGPAFLYVQALSELVFYAWLSWAPAPYNSHMIGIILLNVILVGLSFHILCTYLDRPSQIWCLFSVFLVYWSLIPMFDPGYQTDLQVMLVSTWMPHVYGAPFFLFMMSLASVQTGRLQEIPLLALSGGLLVHGHVAFVMFVLILPIVSIIIALRQTQQSLITLIRCNKRAFIGFVLIVSAFLLPIVLQTIIYFPGEIQKYLSYSASNQAGGHAFIEVLRFVLSYWGPTPLLGWLVCAATLSVSFWASYRKYSHIEDWQKFARQLYIVCAGTTLLVGLYATVGVDDLQHQYVALFYRYVPIALLFPVAIFALNVIISSHTVRALIVMACLGAAMMISTQSKAFTNSYRGLPWLSAAAERLRQESRVVPLDFPHAIWPQVTGLVMSTARIGAKTCVRNPRWQFMFTRRFICNDEELSFGQWVDMREGAGPGHMTFGPPHTIHLTPAQPYRLGAKISFADPETSSKYKLLGWSGTESWGTWTEGEHASLAFRLAQPVTSQVWLQVHATAFVLDKHPELVVIVEVEGDEIARWFFKAGEAEQDLSALIPEAVVRGKSLLRIHFRMATPTSPKALGLSGDFRRLGMGVMHMRLGNKVAYN